MAITRHCSGTRSISLEEFVSQVADTIDPQDEASLAEAAPLLHALANDRELVVRHLNRHVEAQFKRGVIPSAQAILLAEHERFYVRANVWPSNADIAAGRIYQEQFSYDVAHDHNFSFLTVPYFGPGYETEIHEYDHDRVTGYIGEPVELRFLERTAFGGDMVMLYRASRDVHVQYPPAEMSITLNLLVSPPEARMREQYYFDLGSQTVSGYPDESDTSKRQSFFDIASRIGNADTRQLFDDLSRLHPSPRTRLNATEAVERMDPQAPAWERACDDPAELVRRVARQKLAQR